MNKPEIRFDGFSDEWEEKKYVDVSPLQRGFDLPHNMMNEGKYPVVMSNGVLYTHNKYMSKGPGVVTGRSGTIGKVHYIEGDYWPHNTSLWVTNFMGNHPKFIYYFLLKLDLLRLGTGSGVPTLNRNDVHDIQCYIPPLVQEQVLISDFINSIDNTIAKKLQQCEQNVNIKKAMLEKMFPKKGENMPEVRFDGFTETWEQRKLKELVTPVFREVPKPSKSYKRMSIRSHAKGTFHQMVDDPDTVAMEKLFVVHENDLVVNITFAWEHAIAVAKKEDNGLLVSHRFPTYEMNESDPNFIRVLVYKENFRRKMELISPGGAGRNRVLNKNDFIQIEEIVPTFPEQNAIGNFFRSLDTLIEAQQQELEKLQNIKNALLNKMFV